MKEIEVFSADGYRLRLDEKFMYHDADHEHARREDVAKALNGKLNRITVYRNNDPAQPYDHYNVYHQSSDSEGDLGDGEIFGMGCMHFDLKNTNILRQWAGIADEGAKFWLNALKKGFFVATDVKRAVRSAPKDQAASMREALKLFLQEQKKVADKKPSAARVRRSADVSVPTTAA